MPFTGSHPAAVLPLIRLGLPPSALVIGSMIPDLPYYVPQPVSAGTTHSALGIVSVDLLFGIVVFALWHVLLAPAAVAVAPDAVRRRLPLDAANGLRARVNSVGAALLAAVAIVVGAATHVGWDAFTHDGRWGMRHIAWLAEQHGPLFGFRWAQYASGVFGAAVLAIWLLLWWRRTPPAEVDRVAVPAVGGSTRRLAVAVIVLATVIGAVVAGLLAILQPDSVAPSRVGFVAVTRGGSAGVVAALLGAIVLSTRRSPTGSR